MQEQHEHPTRGRLLELHLPYARVVAATYYARRRHDDVGFDDYLQDARLGLVEAAGRFDRRHGVLFRSFAARRMHGAILDGLERATEKQRQIALGRRLPQAAEGADARLLRRLVGSGVGAAVCRLLEGTGMVEPGVDDDRCHAADPCERLATAQLRARVAGCIAELPRQQRDVVRLHYVHDHSFGDIAERLALTRGRISQIHRQALAGLREGLLGPAPVRPTPSPTAGREGGC